MRLLIALPLVVAACTEGYTAGYSDGMQLEYQVGEELMDNCVERGFECWRWLEFKTRWELNVDQLTTFEASLARYKAATGNL